MLIFLHLCWPLGEKCSTTESQQQECYCVYPGAASCHTSLLSPRHALPGYYKQFAMVFLLIGFIPTRSVSKRFHGFIFSRAALSVCRPRVWLTRATPTCVWQDALWTLTGSLVSTTTVYYFCFNFIYLFNRLLDYLGFIVWRYSVLCLFIRTLWYMRLFFLIFTSDPAKSLFSSSLILFINLFFTSFLWCVIYGCYLKFSIVAHVT